MLLVGDWSLVNTFFLFSSGCMYALNLGLGGGGGGGGG